VRSQIRTPLAASDREGQLFWYDSLGCGLGGSQQEDAHILLAHYKENGRGGAVYLLRDRLQNQSGGRGVLNDHMIRAMDTTNLLEGRPVPSVGQSLPGRSRCVSFSILRQNLILATVIAYEVRDAAVRVRRAGYSVSTAGTTPR